MKKKKKTQHRMFKSNDHFTVSAHSEGCVWQMLSINIFKSVDRVKHSVASLQFLCFLHEFSQHLQVRSGSVL